MISTPTEPTDMHAVSQSHACRHVYMPGHAPSDAPQKPLPGAAGRLAGVRVSVKDLFDVAGQTTAAGSKVLANAPAAAVDSAAVARLRAAGALLAGRTNMVEFAFSGIGINPHYGTPVNPADTTIQRIPGGSSRRCAGGAWVRHWRLDSHPSGFMRDCGF
jgi:aspartyl-tRNA(Asn)/glutamyl-tRNA(Gln) amidotransferase subunit A